MHAQKFYAAPVHSIYHLYRKQVRVPPVQTLAGPSLAHLKAGTEGPKGRKEDLLRKKEAKLRKL